MDKVYCYPGTSTLKNKLDIHDKDQLLTAETSLVAIRLLQLYKNPIRGSFDYKPHTPSHLSGFIQLGWKNTDGKYCKV